MKLVGLLKDAAGHVCIICGIVLLVIQVLDWYNPFMDFMGHSMFVLYALCISAISLGISEVYMGKSDTAKNMKYRKKDR